MMTFNPAAAAAFSQAQLLAVAQQQQRTDSDSAAGDALGRYLANAGGLLSAGGQFPFGAGVQPNMEAMRAMMPAGPNGAPLPLPLMYPAAALQQLQDFNAAQAASAGANQTGSTGGGPFPGLIFDPSLAFHPYAALDTSRRKNATRETTLPLKNWLNDHWKNPYPTKGEKVMLAVVTKMSLTQVSTWFANARRRLKKEKKWSPPNRRAEDGDDDDLADLDNMDRPSSSNSNESDDVKEDVDVSMDPNENSLLKHSPSISDDANLTTPKKKAIWSIADTIETPVNGKTSSSSPPAGLEADSSATPKLKDESSPESGAVGAFNLPQHMLQFYSNGLSSQQVLAAYQRLMMTSPQASASIPPNFYAFNPMLLAAFNQPTSGVQPSTTTGSQSTKQNGSFNEPSSVSPTSSTTSQEPSKLPPSSSDDEKTSTTPTSIANTTTTSSDAPSTPQKSPSRSPSPVAN